MRQAKFVSGPPMGHIITMTTTASIGLMAMFLVDLVDIYFLSLLGDSKIIAGVGFATTILFFTVSIAIGMAITMGALVSRSIGARRWRRARRHATNILVFGVVLALFAGAFFYSQAENILDLLGAQGETKANALAYFRIVIPTMPIMVAAMCCSGLLRAIGDAKRAMYLTLVGATINFILDPIFIFGLDMGIEGAAWASVIGRSSFLVVGIYGAHFVHKMFAKFDWKTFTPLIVPILAIATPTILTNIATPFANAYVMKAMAAYGDEVLSGFTIIGRVFPVVFAVVFALSGAVGPIFGQNWGANRIDRVQQTLTDSLKFTGYYTFVVCILLYFSQDFLIWVFNATPDSAKIIAFTCTWASWGFFFSGTQYVANASFNNLGKPAYSTCFNVGKATIGTIPFVIIGGQMYGDLGIIGGQAIGAMAFGIASIFVSLWHIKHLKPATFR